MAKKEDNYYEFEGVVTAVLPSTTFKVKITSGELQDRVITATIAGKIRMHYIKIIEGDIVKVAISPYDLTKGRIIWRGRTK